ncbi:MAG: hypothetical protein EBZ72_05995 [Burkholderiaceae bacterium]|nr:hypothetical protein [Burkholderiaceae bacterium]
MKQILSSQNLSYLLKQAIQCYEKADFDRILKFFGPIQGKIPSKGMAELNNQFNGHESTH